VSAGGATPTDRIWRNACRALPGCARARFSGPYDLKVANEIVRQQDGFFAHGRAFAPLNSRPSRAISMHESTVSRVTPTITWRHRGIFELKYFFTRRSRAHGGEAHSPRRCGTDQTIIEARRGRRFVRRHHRRQAARIRHRHRRRTVANTASDAHPLVGERRRENKLFRRPDGRAVAAGAVSHHVTPRCRCLGRMEDSSGVESGSARSRHVFRSRKKLDVGEALRARINSRISEVTSSISMAAIRTRDGGA